MSTTGHHGDAGTPDCPRCGYDLRGQVEAWTDACDLQGRCSECGMAFFWGDLLSESRRRLPWLYEHACRPLDFRAALGTFARALLPHRFWRTVGAHHEVRLRRLAVWSVGMPVLLFVATWIALVAVWVPLELTYPSAPGKLDATATAMMNAALAQIGQIWNGFSYSPLLVAPWLVTLIFVFLAVMMLLVGLAAPSFLKGTRARRRHIVRITVYSMAGPLFAHAICSLPATWGVTNYMYGFDPILGEHRWWAMELDTTFMLFMISVYGHLGLGLAMLIASWWFGLRRGLGMTRGGATGLTALCLAIAIFAAFVALFWIDLYAWME